MVDQPNYAPWGTQRRMRLMALVGPILALGLLAAGIATTLSHRHGGVVLIVVGAVMLVFWTIALPLARRRNKV